LAISLIFTKPINNSINVQREADGSIAFTCALDGDGFPTFSVVDLDSGVVGGPAPVPTPLAVSATVGVGGGVFSGNVPPGMVVAGHRFQIVATVNLGFAVYTSSTTFTLSGGLVPRAAGEGVS
jgi:hypothetical protein